MSPPRVSVVIPTYERAGLLRRAIAALLRQTLEPAEFEIIVVDNNSGDATRETVERLAATSTTARDRVGGVPAIRYLLETRQGVSYAKNAGLEAARGEIVAYIDDDALARPDWLRLIVQAFEEVHPSPHVVGGPAFPLLLGRRPTWYKDEYDTHSWGENPRFLDRSERFYGLNVAFRRDTLLDAGSFDGGLGMKGEALGFAEDIEVMERLWEHTRGALSVYYVPEASVLHLIPEERVHPHHKLKRAFVMGQTQYLRESSMSGHSRLRLWPRAISRLARSVVEEALRAPRTPPHYGNWVTERIAPLASRLGYFAAAMGLHLDAHRAR